MNDAEARGLLTGIDGARPMPGSLRDDILAAVDSAVPFTGIDAPRPMPDELRRRLEAATVPRTSRAPWLAAVAAAVVVLAAGGLVVGQRSSTTRRPEAATAAAPAPATASAPQLDARAPTAAGSASAGASSRTVVGIVGDASSDVALAFNAYMHTAGVTVVAGSTGAATVDVGTAPWTGPHVGVLFETAFVGAVELHGDVVSLASPVETQARLAVERAGRISRAAVVSSPGEPWASAAAAFTTALRARGVEIVTDGGVVDAAFLALSPVDTAAWVGAHAPPPRGVWAIGSAYDDRLARSPLHVLSPYAPAGGAEEAALVAALPDHALTAGAIHGWVTAKAVVELLHRAGSRPLNAADVRALAGWPTGWGAVAGTPTAFLLEPRDGRFRPA